MTFRFSPQTTARIGLLTAVVVAGCNGSAAVEVDGGGADRPQGSQGEAGIKPDVRLVDLNIEASAPVLPPAPPPNTESKVLAGGRARMVGSLVDVCSNATPASGNGDRWCAFTLPNKVIGQTELWVINATKASAGTAVKCDGTDANCLRLTENVWTGQPMGNVPKFPTIHRFDGDTLIYHAGAPAAQDEYDGPIYAWRAGWPQGKKISGDHGFNCSASPTSDVYICVENLSPVDMEPFQFDLTAGTISGAAPTKIARITPQRPGTTSSQWRVAITRTGDYVVWSTGGATAAETETLYAIKAADISGGEAKKATLGAGISRWALSADGAKVYYFRQYNYPAAGVDPSGTLAMADFPTGANEVILAEKVAALQALSLGVGMDGGIGFFDTVKAGTATYKIIRDRTKPTAITTVVANIPGIIGLSRDLTNLYFYKQFDQDIGTTDGYIVKTDGSGVTCTLTTSTASDQYGTPFTPNGQLVMWVDNIDINEGVGEAWVANPNGCTNKRKWADKMDFWFLHGNDGAVFSDSAGGEASELKYVTFPGGNSIGTPVTIQKQIARIFGVLVDQSVVLYNIAGVKAGEPDGLYAFKTVFSGTGTTDGGVPPAPTPDGSAGQ
jgi:hypothetical protein